MKTFMFLLTLSLGLSACQSPNDASVRNLSARFEPGASRAYYADVSDQSTPAAFRVEIKMPEDFKVQQAGQPAAMAGDIQAFRLFLVNSAIQPAPGTLAPAVGPFTLPANLSSGKQALTFRNLQPGSYYVCAAAFNSTSSFTFGTNLSRQSLNHSYGEGRCALSSGGGLSNSGRVVVNADYSVTGTPQVQITLPLRNAAGAGIQTRIEVYELPG